MIASTSRILPADPKELEKACREAFDTIARLEKELAWFKRQAFGRKADAAPPLPGAVDLFAQEAPPPAPAPRKETITYERKKPGHGRKAFPAHLPRVEEIVEPKDEEKVCACCGKVKTKIGEDVCEVLEHVPQKLFVRRIVRPRYACPAHAEEGVAQANAPQRFIPKGNVGEGLLAEVLLAKYVNHMPLSRQEKNFARMGVSIPVATMVGWMDWATERLAPIVAQLRQKIIQGGIAYSDDTPLPVLKEGKEQGAHRGYLWVYADGRGAVVFDYTSGRGQEGPTAFLADFEGYLHSDAYSVYGALHKAGRVKPAFCWAHARRKFVDALKGGDERARRSVQWCNRLFLVDRYARHKNMSEAEVLALRKRVSEGMLSKLDADLKEIEISVLPKSALGEAIGYLRRHWDGFRAFIGDGRLSLDNNFSERQIRQVVIGRKNYLFCGSEEGARRAAILYSLVCTCKILDVDPWKYLVKVFLVLAESPSTSPESLTPLTLKPHLG